MSKKKTVSVTLEVPEGLMKFLEDIVPSTNYESVKEYLEDAMVDRVRADIEGEQFNPTVKSVAEKYGLKEEFEVKD